MIGVLDSGAGGLPYLAEIRKLLAREEVCYLADAEGFPYGTRPREEITERVHAAVELLVSRASPRAIVIACNTASVVSLERLRHSFELPFVGVVPAVKPAAALTSAGRIGVLATERTASTEYLEALIARHAQYCEVTVIPAPGLVEAVEYGCLEGQRARAALAQPIRKLRAANSDTVVLGCTHFVHLRTRIEQMLGPKVRVIDSVGGVARQTARIVDALPAELPAELPATVDRAPRTTSAQLFVTGFHCARHQRAYERFAASYDLELCYVPRHNPLRQQ